MAVLLAVALVLSGCGLLGSGNEEAVANEGQPGRPTTAPADGDPSATAPPNSTPDGDPSSQPPAPASSSTTLQQATPRAGGDSLNDPLFPGLGNSGYDVEHYNIEINLTGGEFRAQAELRIFPDFPLDQFNLDLIGLTVDRVFVNGVEADVERRGRELIVQPSSALPQGTVATVRVEYRGQPEPVDDPSGFFALGWHTRDWGTFVASQPLGAATWFPANDYQTDKATFRVAVTVPLGQVAAGPGLLTSQTSTGTTSTFVWEMDDPMATYLASVVTGDFTIFTTEGAGGVVIRNVLPTDRAAQLVPALASTNEMLEQFTELFGPYPFDSYGVVAVPDDLSFALENQTLSLFDVDFLTLRRRTVENVLAHELAHQWFGNSVSSETWEDIWLSEGFASWADQYWTEEDGGTTFDQRAAFAAAERLRPPTQVRAATMFDSTVYLRGALTLEALRRTVGDQDFFALLKIWVVQFEGQTASTEDFLALVRTQFGAVVEDLMRSWLFDQLMPDLPPDP